MQVAYQQNAQCVLPVTGVLPVIYPALATEMDTAINSLDLVSAILIPPEGSGVLHLSARSVWKATLGNAARNLPSCYLQLRISKMMVFLLFLHHRHQLTQNHKE